VDSIFGKAKNWTKKDWIILGLTTFMASVIFIILSNFRQGFEASMEIFIQFLIFFVIFGGLQILFGGIFHNKNTKE